MAALLPVAACVLQWLFWPMIVPFVWFLFYPVVFLSAWLGGTRAGVAATFLSTSLVWWFFMEPVHVLLKPRPFTYLNALLFIAMGFLFAYFQQRLRKARSKADAAALREQGNLLDRMSRLAMVGGWEFDVASGAGSWTAEVARIHDLEPATQPSVAMGLRYFHERARPVIAEAVQRAVAEGRPYDLELELVSAKGVLKWVRTMAEPVWEDGRVVRVQGAMQDITYRKHMELALRNSEARYRALFEQAGVGVVEVEAATGRFLGVNGKFCDILGYSEAELLALTFGEITHPQERARDLHQIERLGAGEISSYSTEKRYSRKDGTVVWVELNARPLRVPGAEALHLVSIVADITARRQAESEILRLNATLERRVEERTAELRAANQELESFSYAVSHDLRAPLRAMGGFSQALLEDLGATLSGEGKTYLDQILLASQRMSGLIDGILQLSRITRGDLERTTVDVSALARRLLAELAQAEPGRGVSCQVEPGLVAHGDPRMVAAALANLLGNAWKYTAKVAHPGIEVSRVLADGRSWIRVSDNGAGFDLAYADKLFQPFQRLHRQDEFPGLGIGLATAHRIVQRHGGQLKATSAPGQGATFLLYLPAPDPTE